MSASGPEAARPGVFLAEVSRALRAAVGGELALHGGWVSDEPLPGSGVVRVFRAVYAVPAERAAGLAAWRDVVEHTLDDGTELVALESALWARLLQRSHGGVHGWVRGERHAAGEAGGVALARLEALASRCVDAGVAQWWSTRTASPEPPAWLGLREPPDALRGTARLVALDRWIAEARRLAG